MNKGLVVVAVAEVVKTVVVKTVVESEIVGIIYVTVAVVIGVVIAILAKFRPHVIFLHAYERITIGVFAYSLYKFSVNGSNDR